MMMDHYKTLGVSRDASQEEIKKAFRKLAMTHHPDKGGDPVEFQRINEAYGVLSDTNKRFQYDNPHARPQFNHPGGFGFNVNGFDLNDLFGQIFGERFNQHQQNVKPTYRTRVTVTLVDAYNGTEQVLQLGTPSGMKVINVKVPPGARTGSSYRYDNLIEEGTLIIEFVILPDLRFDREGDDLYSNFPISVLDLIVGTKTKFITIGGKELEVNIRPGTQPNQQIRIPGYGMPRNDGSHGDQILLLKPFIPVNIDSDIIESIKRSQVNKKD